METQTPQPDANKQPQALDPQKALDLLKQTLQRFDISDIDSNATPDTIFSNIRAKMAIQLEQDPEFGKKLHNEGYGKAMGTVASILKRDFGVTGSDNVPELFTKIKETMSSDAQEVARAKQIAAEKEEALNKYEQQFLPQKLQEIEQYKKEAIMDIQIKGIVNSFQLIGNADFLMPSIIATLKSNYSLDIESSGQLVIKDKSGKIINHDGSIKPMTSQEIIKKMLDSAGALKNNNVPPAKLEEPKKVMDVQPPTANNAPRVHPNALKHYDELKRK